MNVNQSVSLNLTADGIPPRLHMVQGDSNTRTIVASLWDGSQPYNVPTSAAVMMRFRKPDGTGGLYDVAEGGAKISVSGNVVTAPVATQLLTVAGVVFAQLDIYGTATGAAAEKLATFRLAIEVAPSVYPDAKIISSDYYNILTAKVAEAVAAADRAEQATVHTPAIGSNGNWYVWDQAAGKYVDSGVSAQQGPKGDKGDTGATGERGTGWWATSVSTPQSGAASSMSALYAAYKVGDFLINPSLGYVYEVTDVTVSGNTSGIQYEYKGSLKGPKGDRGTGWWETSVSTPQSGAASSMSTLYAAYKVGDFLINPSLGYVYEVTDVTVSGNTSGIQYEYKGTLGGQVQIATAEVAGIVKPGADFDIAADGTLSLYEAISIETLKLNKDTVQEFGASVTGFDATWALNKTPAEQTITVPGTTGSEDTAIIENIGADVRSTTDLTGYAAELWSGVKGQARTNFFTLALSVKDARGAAASKSVSIQWFNGVYTGAAVGEIVDGVFLRSELTKSLQGGRAKTFTVNAEAGEYIWYACPVRYGTPSFSVGGFDGGFSKVKTFDFTNASNFTESYQVWRSDNAGLGSTTVVVS